MSNAKLEGDSLKTNYQTQEKVIFPEAFVSHSVQGGMMSLHTWSHTFLQKGQVATAANGMHLTGLHSCY